MIVLKILQAKLPYKEFEDVWWPAKVVQIDRQSVCFVVEFESRDLAEMYRSFSSRISLLIPSTCPPTILSPPQRVRKLYRHACDSIPVNILQVHEMLIRCPLYFFSPPLMCEFVGKVRPSSCNVNDHEAIELIRYEYGGGAEREFLRPRPQNQTSLECRRFDPVDLLYMGGWWSGYVKAIYYNTNGIVNGVGIKVFSPGTDRNAYAIISRAWR